MHQMMIQWVDMKAKKEVSVVLKELYLDYEGYRRQGLSKYDAIKKLDYAHPITLSRLEKIIDEKEKWGGPPF